MKAVKGFIKGSESEKAFLSYIGSKQNVYIAYRQQDGTFLRTTNGRATSVAKSENQLSKAYLIK